MACLGRRRRRNSGGHARHGAEVGQSESLPLRGTDIKSREERHAGEPAAVDQPGRDIGRRDDQRAGRYRGRGHPGEVLLSIPGNGARTFTAQQLEAGDASIILSMGMDKTVPALVDAERRRKQRAFRDSANWRLFGGRIGLQLDLLPEPIQ